MGNQTSVADPCIFCKEPVTYNPTNIDPNRFCAIGASVPVYCSASCQLKCWKKHWTILVDSTEKTIFNKLLAHLAQIQAKSKTNIKRIMNTCIVDEITNQCILCKEVYKWIRFGAEQDDLDCQDKLGYCYLIGFGVIPSDVEAVNWFGKAAAGGHTKSIVSLESIFKKLELACNVETSSSSSSEYSYESDDPI
jgi:hypothetical protein